jgi:hypothetical protein
MVGVRVQDDAVERLRVAIEYRRYDAVARGGDPIAEDPVNLTARKSQKAYQRSISGFFPPFPEQVKKKNSGVGFARAAGSSAR